MRFKKVAILLILLLLMVPAYAMLQYLQRTLRPRESGRQFLLWLVCSLLFVFVFTFAAVFIIRLLFPLP
ncbi:MAG: hypothetical protein NTW29_00490 [Bacteroidetes bacterium]|nr:hypothetical protein [Bacteroidota bacterium]